MEHELHPPIDEFRFHRFLRDEMDAFDKSCTEFRQLFRMEKNTARELCQLLQNRLTGTKQHAMSVQTKVLTALHFYAQGNYQKGLGEELFTSMAQRTVSKVLHEVTDALYDISNDWIRFPTSADERRYISHCFHNKIGFPWVLGSIDCTIVPIMRPTEYKHLYYSYKHVHALNVQVITDCHGMIRNVKIEPGATNDKSVWRASVARQHMCALRNNGAIMEDEGPYYLIADGGYDPSPIMLTPFQNSRNGSVEARYNVNLCKTRVITEQTLGWWKQKWRCITKERQLHYHPQFAGRIVIATTVLHNFIKSKEDASIRIFANEDDVQFFNVDIDHNIALDYRGGLQIMQNIAQEFFE